ncbi:MAG: hypothetical protein WAO71_05335 [Gallionella sp.]
MDSQHRNTDFVLYDVNIADPAPATNFQMIAGPLFRDKIVMVKYDFTASAAAGNRFLNLTLLNAVLGNHRIPSNQLVIANNTMSLYWYVGLTQIIVDPGLAWACIPLPQDLWLRSPGHLASLIDGMLAGDQISGIHVRTLRQFSLMG